jgi:hypothetical protein
MLAKIGLDFFASYVVHDFNTGLEGGVKGRVVCDAFVVGGDVGTVGVVLGGLDVDEVEVIVVHDEKVKASWYVVSSGIGVVFVGGMKGLDEEVRFSGGGECCVG